VEQEFQPAFAQAPGTTAIDRGAQLLVHVLESEGPVGLTELANRTGMPKSTASRLVSVLERNGLVQQDGPRGRLRPGPAILRVAARGLLERTLIEAAQPSLDALAHASGETINLGVPGPRGVEHIAEVESRHFLGTGQWLDRQVDYHCTAVGKVLVAFGAAELPAGELRSVAPSTITDREQLAVELRTVRRRGAATAIDELEPGLTAMAAPVRDASGQVVAALSISGPTLRMTAARIAELEPILISEARALSACLGNPDAGEHAA
jgi:IclR family transcriptional regulator, acetate operon repressor